MILARRMVYDPDRFEYLSVCGTVEYEDTRYRTDARLWIGLSLDT